MGTSLLALAKSIYYNAVNATRAVIGPYLLEYRHMDDVTENFFLSFLQYYARF